MIYGKRMTGRPVEAEDQAFLCALNADPLVRSNVVGWDWPTSLFEQRQWFQQAQSSATRRWIVEAEGESIGLTGLWDIDWHNRNALTALKFGTAGRGRGFGRDAIMAMMAFAFYDAGLERLYSAILTGNEPSRRVYVEKCGWTVEGVSRAHVYRRGELVDLIQVGILRAEFDALPDADAYRSLALDGPERGSGVRT